MTLGDLFDTRAFTLGMVGLINPCGFALLPAYLGYFVGTDRAEDNRVIALNRAQVVGLSMSAGFLAVFGLIGLVLTEAMAWIGDYLPWVVLLMGLGLAGMGVAMVLGFKPLLSLPKIEKGTGSRSAGSMFLFGLSYAVASLSCTLPTFFSAIGTATTGASFGHRLGSFISYGLGMGLLATGLTLAVAFGRHGLVGLFRRILPRIEMISALIMIVVGLYLAWYGWWSTDPIGIPDGPILELERIQADVSNWIDARTAILGWGFLAINAGLAAAGFVARRRARGLALTH